MIRIALLCCWLGSLLWAGPALAHSVLLQTTPADRAVLPEAPAGVVLQFNEAVRPVVLQLIDASGSPVAGEATSAPGDTHSFRPDRALPPGQYLLSYRVVSDDGHPIAGTIVFAVGVAPATWAAAEETAEGPWRWYAAVNRALWMLSLALAGGAAVFVLLVPAPAEQLRTALSPTVTGASFLAIATAGLAVVFEGGVVLGHGSLIEMWRAGFATTQARQSLAAILLTAAVWLAWRRGASRLGAFAAVALLATIALTGHVVTAATPWITAPVLLLHGIPALLWVGSFLPLIAVVQAPPSQSDLVIPQFSRLALAGVGVLAAAGAVIAMLQVRDIAALTATAYGVGLLAKNALAAPLLLLAAYNRLGLTPGALAGEPRARARLSTTISMELLLGVAILSISAVLAQTAPPRSLSEPTGHEAHSHEETGAGVAVGAVSAGKSALIGVTPARTGRNTITVALRGAGWTDLNPRAVTASLSNVLAGIEPIVRELAPVAAGVYEYSGPELAVAGEWTVRIDVDVSDFERIAYVVPIPVQ